MPVGNWTSYNKSRLNFFNLTNLLAATAANFRLALVTSAYTPDTSDTGHELWASASGNEIAGSGGYTTGGGALTNVALSLSSGMKFTSDPFTWTASGGGIAAWRYGVLYYLGTLNGKLNPLVGYFLGDTSPADIPATTAPNTLTVSPAAAGIFTSP